MSSDIFYLEGSEPSPPGSPSPKPASRLAVVDLSGSFSNDGSSTATSGGAASMREAKSAPTSPHRQPMALPEETSAGRARGAAGPSTNKDLLAPMPIITSPSLLGVPPLVVGSLDRLSRNKPTAASPLARPAIVPSSGSSDEDDSGSAVTDGRTSPDEGEKDRSAVSDAIGGDLFNRALSASPRLSRTATSSPSGSASSGSAGRGPRAGGPGGSAGPSRGLSGSSANTTREKRIFSLGSPSRKPSNPVLLSDPDAVQTSPIERRTLAGAASLPPASSPSPPGPQMQALSLGRSDAETRRRQKSSSGSSAGSLTGRGDALLDAHVLRASPSPPRTAHPAPARLRSGSFNSPLAGPATSGAAFIPQRTRMDGGRLRERGSLLGLQPVASLSAQAEAEERASTAAQSQSTPASPDRATYDSSYEWKVKGKERSASGSTSLDPLPEGAAAMSVSPQSRLLANSPGRSRRHSEFLQPAPVASSYHRLSVAHPSRSPTLGASSFPVNVPASNISPLNPLPSPWATPSTESSSPFSADGSLARDSLSGSGSQNSSLRLNRVPTAVRLATELVKSVSPSTASEAGSAVFSPPALTRTRSRDLGRGGRPPATPVASRNTTPEEVPILPDVSQAASPSSGPDEMPDQAKRRHPSITEAPTSSTSMSQVLSRSPVRQRPSLPPPSAFGVAGTRTSSMAAPPPPAMSSYRTSLHDDPTSNVTAAVLANSNLMPPPPLPAARDMPASYQSERYLSADSHRTGGPKTRVSSVPGLGLGWEAPNDLRLGRVTSISGDRFVAGPSRTSGMSAGDQGDQDAHRHANMILESRKAKMQRWRPGSSGSGAGGAATPEILSGASANYLTVRGSTNRAALPSALSSNDLAGQWSPTELANLGVADDKDPTQWGLSRTATLPSEGPAAAGDPLNALLGRSAAYTSTMMERGFSTAGSINGVEWVDWLDEYKSLKEAKLRSQGIGLGQADDDQQHAEADSGSKPPAPDLGSGSDHQASSRTASPDNTPRAPKPRTGSMASSRPSMEMSASPSMHRRMPRPLADKPGQVVGASRAHRSSSDANQQHHRKRKNLAKKMEGWWSAVKSNFSPAPGDSPPSGPLGPGKAFPALQEGSHRQRKVSGPLTPSAPGSPRESLAQGVRPEESSLPRKRPSQLFRGLTASADSRSVSIRTQDFTGQAPSAVLARATANKQSEGNRSARQPELSSASQSLPDQTEIPFRIRTASGLEARRNQPPLSLQLAPQIMHLSGPLQRPSRPGQPSFVGRQSTAGGSSISSRQLESGSSRTSSYNKSTNIFTPGGLDTPSPVNILGMEDGSGRRSIPRESSGSGEIAQAFARQHVARRLAAAKDTCDSQLAAIAVDVTFFVEGHIHQSQSMGPFEAALSGDEADGMLEASSSFWSAEHTDDDADDEVDRSGRIETRPIPLPARRRGPSSRRSSVSLAASPAKRKDPFNRPIGPTSPGRRLSAAITRTARSQDISYRLAAHALGTSLDPATQSSSSSRSTSRSRSPMPGHASVFGRNKLIGGDESPSVLEGLLPVLQKLIGLATDVQETSVDTFIAKPALSREFVAQARRLGQQWDEHPAWPHRDYFVRLLMAVAALSRVVEWWEAESVFWDFKDEEQANEPLTFVMKPARDNGYFGALAPGFDLNTSADSPSGPVTNSSMSSYHPLSPVDLITGGSETREPTEVSRTATPIPASGSMHMDDLHLQAEHAKSVNIVLELSLGGEIIEWVNPAWEEVLGSDTSLACGSPISAWLAPADVSILADASRHLEADDSQTAQARFRLLRSDPLDEEADESFREPGPVYVEFEGVGMLMRDRDSGMPSHTMWVVKPVTLTNVPVGQGSAKGEESAAQDDEATFPLTQVLSTKAVLCRICERDVPTWFFEKHNETCNEVHRLEADIAMANERLSDLCAETQALNVALDHTEPTSPVQYGGMLLAPVPSREQAQAGPLAIAVKKIQHDLLEQAIDVLTAAHEISTPSVREDAADIPIQYQRLLSPNSEDRLLQISRWIRPDTEDPAIAALFEHVDELVRAKQTVVNRMRNTILYAERVRQEWEDKVDRMLAAAESGSNSLSGSDSSGDESKADSEGSPKAPRQVMQQAKLPVTQASHMSPPSTLHDAAAPRTPLSENVPDTAASAATITGGSISHTPESVVSPAASLALPVLGHKRKGSSSRHLGMEAPLSPRIPSVAPSSRVATTSIKDFEIIKPISKGAFGSVYLAKKRATGDYFAIKALKKSDMIAKNQITNVKAERTILMDQASSPYVAKLFFSFQNKDYLYLVMEYLNGGDCAALIKTLGGLPEEWTRNYIAEVVLGLEYLHTRGIVHRDLKPDNLLIDAHGHLKLTDFGLSKIGLLNRQIGGPRPAVLRGTSLRRLQLTGRSNSPLSSSVLSSESPLPTPDALMLPPAGHTSSSYFSSHLTDAGSADESSGSESLTDPRHSRRPSSFHRPASTGRLSTTSRADANDTKKDAPKFVGTPDYLCPESILGIGSDDCAVDWWALGAVMYEFLYGFPPFHDETPDKVFDNIISRRISWYEEDLEISAEARDLMEKLMCMDPKQRLGARGADEVKAHPWFTEVDWVNLCNLDANFVPNVTDPESTDYFDARGAKHEVFEEESKKSNHGSPSVATFAESASRRSEHSASDADRLVPDDFGTFQYKNLVELKQANDNVIKQLRTDHISALSQGALPRDRRLSIVAKAVKTPKRNVVTDPMMPPSPATSTSSSTSTPSRGSCPPRTPVTTNPHLRRPSDSNPLDRVKSTEYPDGLRRKSAPDRVRSPSLPDVEPLEDGKVPMTDQASYGPRKLSETSSIGQRAVDVLVAEDNPISQKILDTLLTRMGCRCVSVNDGAEALAAAMADIRFDVLILDLMMPNVTGEEVARMIRSTQNVNVNTPIIAVTSYEIQHANIGTGSLFSAVLSKPLIKADLVECLAKLGFVLGSAAPRPPAAANEAVDPLDRTNKTMAASAKLQAM